MIPPIATSTCYCLSTRCCWYCFPTSFFCCFKRSLLFFSTRWCWWYLSSSSTSSSATSLLTPPTSIILFIMLISDGMCPRPLKQVSFSILESATYIFFKIAIRYMWHPTYLPLCIPLLFTKKSWHPFYFVAKVWWNLKGRVKRVIFGMELYDFTPVTLEISRSWKITLGWILMRGLSEIFFQMPASISTLEGITTSGVPHRNGW